jgi:(1->4)-alpha-D-glucan 1-alpha-D-glucosylmutase
VVVEKILQPEESLPEHWPVHGTTGYDCLARLNGIFVAQDNEKDFTDVYTRFTTAKGTFSELLYESKKLIMQVSLSSELNVLAHQLNRLSEKNRRSRDFTLNSLTHALREIIACFPVYRTYIDEGGVSDPDRAVIERAVARAKRNNPALDASIFNFVRDVLLLRVPHAISEEEHQAHLTFVRKVQQYTGPVMAKGMEDTAFYRDHRLVSLNEVGSVPDRFGCSLTSFHAFNQQRGARWPHALVATTTHDTKRSEDVRARLNALSEMPQAWKATLSRWSKLNKRKRSLVEGQPVPDRNEEYLLYQTLLGVWPLTELSGDAFVGFKQRIRDYMRKATKEAKVNTSWINPNQAYDEALQAFVDAVLDDTVFLDDFEELADIVAWYGMYNALSQTLLKLTVPGVPDLYQGTELWDFSLVDPDNRRPIDYDHRRHLLKAIQTQLRAAEPNLGSLAQELLGTWQDGRIKLYVTHRTLTYRRDHPDLFRSGRYLPLEVLGAKQAHVCAFARQYEHHDLFVVVPRLLISLIPDPHAFPLGPQVWGETWLILPSSDMASPYLNLLTGEILVPTSRDGKSVLALGAILATFPVALCVPTLG